MGNSDDDGREENSTRVVRHEGGVHTRYGTLGQVQAVLYLLVEDSVLDGNDEFRYTAEEDGGGWAIVVWDDAGVRLGML
jgi:hypothetical protein